MFILKNNYYLYIENIKLLNLNLIKKGVNLTLFIEITKR